MIDTTSTTTPHVRVPVKAPTSPQSNQAEGDGVGYEQEYHQDVYGWLHDEDAYRRKSELIRERFFPMVTAEDSVFEYGLGLGVNLAMLPAKTKEGYDISDYARSFSEGKGIRTFANEADVPKANYDVVISSHCLEHLEAPAANLRYLKSLLKPTGKLVLLLPIEERSVPKKVNEMDVHQHLYGWSFRTIDNLLAHCGYTVVENQYISAGYRPYRMLRHRSEFLFNLVMKIDALIRPLHRRHMRIVATPNR